MLRKRIGSMMLAVLCLVMLIVPAFASASPKPFLDFSFDDGKVNISVGDDTSITDSESAYKNLFTNYKSIAQVCTAICIITSLICFLYQIAKLGAAGDNDRERKVAIKGILITGLVLTGFGGLEILVSVFWNAL